LIIETPIRIIIGNAIYPKLLIRKYEGESKIDKIKHIINCENNLTFGDKLNLSSINPTIAKGIIIKSERFNSKKGETKADRTKIYPPLLGLEIL
jgi:hypothetical protein